MKKKTENTCCNKAQNSPKGSPRQKSGLNYCHFCWCVCSDAGYQRPQRVESKSTYNKFVIYVFNYNFLITILELP